MLKTQACPVLLLKAGQALENKVHFLKLARPFAFERTFPFLTARHLLLQKL